MIYLLAEDKPILVMFLLPKDIDTIKAGNTVWVDPRMLPPGRTVDTVVVSFARTKEEVTETLQKGGWQGQGFNEKWTVDPKADEGRCEGCDGVIPKASLYRGKCIVCWYRMALDSLGSKAN